MASVERKHTNAPKISKEGPCGGPGGSPKDMMIVGVSRIARVAIRHGDAIDAIAFFVEGSCRVHSYGPWGGNGGSPDEINFRSDEHIISVRGYVSSYSNISAVVRSLVLETNLGVYGPYGKSEGVPFELSVPGTEIIGFFARSGDLLDAIGVYVQPYTLTKKVGPCGGVGGSAHDMNLSGITRIVKVDIRHGDAIDGIDVYFDINGTIESTGIWGGNTGSLTEIILKPHEYIKTVRGTVGTFGDLFIVRSLELITNLGAYGPFGKADSEQTPFELSAVNGKIIGFHGRSGSYLDAIGVYIEGLDATDTTGIIVHHAI